MGNKLCFICKECDISHLQGIYLCPVLRTSFVFNSSCTSDKAPFLGSSKFLVHCPVFLLISCFENVKFLIRSNIQSILNCYNKIKLMKIKGDNKSKL